MKKNLILGVLLGIASIDIANAGTCYCQFKGADQHLALNCNGRGSDMVTYNGNTMKCDDYCYNQIENLTAFTMREGAPFTNYPGKHLECVRNHSNSALDLIDKANTNFFIDCNWVPNTKA